jgi:hypothetical protein
MAVLEVDWLDHGITVLKFLGIPQQGTALKQQQKQQHIVSKRTAIYQYVHKQ